MKKTRDPKEYALRLLSIRMRSIKELRDRLKSRGFNEEDIKSVIDDLKSVGLLDDREFARSFYESMKRKLKSDFLIRQELLKRGVEEEIIDEVLKGERTEEIKDKIRDLFERWGTDEKSKRRVYQFFRRRGYTHSFIIEVMAEVLKELKEKEDLG